jgi:hypothetical protein
MGCGLRTLKAFHPAQACPLRRSCRAQLRSDAGGDLGVRNFPSTGAARETVRGKASRQGRKGREGEKGWVTLPVFEVLALRVWEILKIFTHSLNYPELS